MTRRIAAFTMGLCVTSAAGAQTCHPHWETVIGQPGLSQVGPRFALARFAGDLYAGGLFFLQSSPTTLRGIARWDGSAWTSVGAGVGGGTPEIAALAVYDDGGGEALYAGGRFTSAGGIPVNRIAKWDGAAWSPVGGGIGDPEVLALIVFDDGSGEALIAGGDFVSAGAAIAHGVAKWNGSFWAPIGPNSFLNPHVVHALAAFDDGGGPALYVGGRFTWAGAGPANHVAKWSGSGWEPLGLGVNGGPLGGAVNALAAFDARLYVGGDFTSAGAIGAANIARWNGMEWSGVGVGLDAPVHVLSVFDDGVGPALYAGGAFVYSGLTFLNHLGRWNAGAWATLSGGCNGLPLALHAVPGALFVGGLISVVGCGAQSSAVAEWQACPACYPDCNGDASLTVADFGCFQTRYVVGDLWANCNGDCGLSVADFGCFQTAFVLGCP